MAELSKFFKIVLLINVIAALFYGIVYLFIPEIFAVLIDSPAFSLQFWRLWGITCVSLAVFGVIGFIRNEWTTLKMLIEFVILWLILMEIVNIIYLVDPAYTHSLTSFSNELIDIIVIAFLIVLNIYAYLKENKR
ncbi:MAG: hypothetical protein ACFFD5_10560 [Candidatus Thorarchaeota archaeon]